MSARHDWYQSQDSVTIDLFAKNIDASTVEVISKEATLVLVKFSAPSAPTYERLFQLSQPIESDKCRYTVGTTKLEIQLTKTQPTPWKNLEALSSEDKEEANPIREYPSSAKTKQDWSSLETSALRVEDEEDANTPDAFFKKLYAGASEDKQRAMMKSFIESKGTVLSTNWDTVGSEKVKPALPKGLELEKE